MFIQYNDTNVHALPTMRYREVRLRNKKTGKIRTVKKLDVAQSPNDVKWLRPGWNEFPKDVWEQNKDHPSIQSMLKSGKIVVMADKVVVQQGKKKIAKVVGQDDSEITLEVFPERRAIDIVKNTYDRDLIQRWLDEETRHKVKRALVKQIEPLRGPDKESEKDED